MLSEIFIGFLTTSFIGCLLTVFKLAYKSKCKEVNFCCIRIIRDTQLEEKEFEFAATHKMEKDDDPSTPRRNDLENQN